MGGQTWSHCQPRVDLRKLVPKTLMLCDFQMEKSSTSLKRLSDSEVTEKTCRKVRNYRLRVIMTNEWDNRQGGQEESAELREAEGGPASLRADRHTRAHFWHKEK